MRENHAEKDHMVQDLPEHEVNIRQRFTGDKLIALHVSVQLLQLRHQRILAVTLALLKLISELDVSG